MVGETPYAEGAGDRPGAMGLDTTDLNTITTLRAAGVPVVVVLVSGRPLDIAAQLPNWNALVAAWLPGTEGKGVADVLFGVYAPTGKLPMTWMQSASQQPINDGDGKTGRCSRTASASPTAPPPNRERVRRRRRPRASPPSPAPRPRPPPTPAAGRTSATSPPVTGSPTHVDFGPPVAGLGHHPARLR